MEENSHGNTSYIALMEDGKRKKHSQGPSTNSDAKKRHVKLEYRKLKANQAARTVPENSKVKGSKTQTTKVTTTFQESVIHFFIVWEATSNLASR